MKATRFTFVAVSSRRAQAGDCRGGNRRRGAAPRAIEAEGAAEATGPRRVVSSDAQTIVDTTAGKIRGYSNDGIFTFKGVPYAEPATGERRFMPPVTVAAWTGVRNALAYGPICPTGITDPAGGDNAARADEDAFLLYRTAGRAGEDCLRLNVWTPSTSGGRRPVMIYMHGRGFTSHSSSGLASYDGTNLARRHDVVVVTHNHRLNTLGYLDLSEIGGERYTGRATSACRHRGGARMGARQRRTIRRRSAERHDIRPIRRRRQSQRVDGHANGKGLFQRAIVQSGSQLRMRDQQAARRFAAAVASELGLSAGRIADLHSMPLGRFYGGAGRHRETGR